MKQCWNFLNIIFSILFQGLLPTTILFYKRAQISNVLSQISEKFWTLDDVMQTKREEDYYLSTYKRLKWIVYSFFSTSILACAILIFLPIAFENKQLPLKCYKPPFVGFYELFFLQTLTLVSGTLSYSSVVTLIMTVTKLTQLQFRLLNRQIQNAFAKNRQQDLRILLKYVVEHHNFLLRWVQNLI